jgi:hypothetical protein
MTRVLAFLVLAGALAAYARWVYLRVELAVPAGRWLSIVRGVVLVTVLLLLFDPEIPRGGGGGSSSRWVLLDASLSMTASGADGASAWEGAADRARALRGDGWRVMRFGTGALEPVDGDAGEATLPGSRLVPALQSAAEAGAREVRVLSDGRFEDAVALRAALEGLPLRVTFERFGAPVTNVGLTRLDVPDLPRPDGRPVAEVEVHGGEPGDSIEIAVLEENVEVATVRVAAPSPGLRTRTSIELPTPASTGRIRYTASVRAQEDGFAGDDEAVTYTSVGFEEGGLVLLSLRPDWEPRYLLPVLEEVTGLSATGYLRAGPDRYVRLGRASDRGAPADSASVRSAVAGAALLVVHGLGRDVDPWLSSLVEGGRRLVLPADADGARRLGLEVGDPQAGEWYASADVPTSPVAGALAGVNLQGLPPLTGVMVPTDPERQPALLLQLRGTGAPLGAFRMTAGEEGRSVVALASGWWRWAARDEGYAAYRSLWSGLAGWLLGGERVQGAEPRPESWLVERGEPVAWSLPGDSSSVRLSVRTGDALVSDTIVTGGGRVVMPSLPPGSYAYAIVDDATGDSLGAGRFDVTATTPEMLPAVADSGLAALAAAAPREVDAGGRPMRTHPLPYLLVIGLLCGEWIVRRRSGLR